MEKLIQGFPAQLQESIEISKHISVEFSQPIHNILICGLGGSGIGGNLVEGMLRNVLKVPIITNKTYNIPNWVSKNTLVIFSSYSGNTEETLSCFDIARHIECPKFAISSGGTLLEKCKEQGIPYSKIPGGLPPRSALGYSFIQTLRLVEVLEFTDNNAIKEVAHAAELLIAEQANIQKYAAKLANQIAQKTPVIYVRDRMESVAIRWRQQLNENAKILCWHHVIPEMNHNELVGWRDNRNDVVVLMLRNDDDPERIKLRYEINKSVIQKYCTEIIEIHSIGNSFIERSLYHIHLGDWLSTELAKIRNQDAIEVNVIDYLKGELAKHD